MSLMLLLGACRSEETSQAQAPDAARLDAEHDEPVTEAAPDTDGSTVIDGGNGMVLMPEGYAIDATEVTRAAYAAWLEAKPPADGQPKYCEWNTTFESDAECMASDYVCKTDCDQHPQVCLDWCDAHAYCKAKGKRLCGKIGGGSLPWNERPKPTLGQWINACTSHGEHEYPYGDQPLPGGSPTTQLCNDSSFNAGSTFPVASLADRKFERLSQVKSNLDHVGRQRDRAQRTEPAAIHGAKGISRHTDASPRLPAANNPVPSATSSYATDSTGSKSSCGS